MTPELSRPVAADHPPQSFVVDASAAERAALAVRLGIVKVCALSCRYVLRRDGPAVAAEGALSAEVVQRCVVSLEPVAQSVAERFAVRFVPAGALSADEDPEAPDEIPFEGRLIDLGEATAEQLGLALDPYPRRDDAALDPSALDGGGGGAFAGLAGLRPKD